MNTVHIKTVRTIGSACLAAACIAAAFAQEPQIDMKEGHIAPVRVRLTFTNGGTETGLLTNSYWHGGINGPFQFHANSFSGGNLAAWYDALHAVREINDKDELLFYKNGEQRRVGLEWFAVELTGPGGSTETIECGKIRSIEFLSAPRHDKMGNAMFSNWRYSPFTGERRPLG